jgi:prepilin-type N-terminal cleavage/methylation domain-containing protein
MMIKNTIDRQQQGFSLIEMMLAMLIGIIIMGGILSVYNNTREAQRVSDDQMHLVSDARFAIETIAYDLRHAGVFGGTNLASTIKCHKGDPNCSTALATAAGDCETRWYLDITVPIFASEAINPYSTCAITSHLGNTDLLVVRYADSNPIDTASLVSSTAYVRSNYQAGELFIGTTPPVIPDDTSALTNNHLLVSRAYYVSDFTDYAGDGLPSLRRVDLIAGPAVQDQLILPGVENLQIQFGIDTDKDRVVDQYVNADQVPDWTKVYSARVWVLVRSQHTDKTVDTSETFTIAGNSVSFGNDGYRRLLISSVINLRNMIRVDELSVGG